MWIAIEKPGYKQQGTGWDLEFTPTESSAGLFRGFFYPWSLHCVLSHSCLKQTKWMCCLRRAPMRLQPCLPIETHCRHSPTRSPQNPSSVSSPLTKETPFKTERWMWRCDGVEAWSLLPSCPCLPSQNQMPSLKRHHVILRWWRTRLESARSWWIGVRDPKVRNTLPAVQLICAMFLVTVS